MIRMFGYTTKLEHIYVGDSWNVRSGVDTTNMFYNSNVNDVIRNHC